MFSDYWHISPLNIDIKLGIRVLIPLLNIFKIKIIFIIPQGKFSVKAAHTDSKHTSIYIQKEDRIS